MTFELVKVNMCYLKAPLRWLMEQKNPKFLGSFQNAQRGTTNLAVNEHVRTYLCEVCLLTSNDCRNEEHSDVTEGKTCEGVCIIWEKSVNITRSVFKFRAQPRPQGFTHPCHFLMEKPWGRGCFRTIIVGHVIRSLMLITCSYNRRDFSRGTGEDAHQNDGAEPLLETSLNVAKAVFTSEK